MLWCEVVVPNPFARILVGVFYRPPSTDVSYIQELEKSLSLIEVNENNSIVILPVKLTQEHQVFQMLLNLMVLKVITLRLLPSYLTHSSSPFLIRMTDYWCRIIHKPCH